MKRPKLNKVPLSTVWPPLERTRYITMSTGQWDTLLDVAYKDDCVLLEVDHNERLLNAYRRNAPQALSA